MRIATDTGGTFTDCVFVHRGKLEVLKVPSQPAEPAAPLQQGIGAYRGPANQIGFR